MKTYYKILLLLFCSQIYAQEKGDFSISPYGGLSNPISDSKNLFKSGTSFGIDGTYQFSEAFSLGADFNFTTLSFNDGFSVNGLPNNYLQTNNKGNLKRNTYSIGPVFKLPIKKTNINLYALGGISSIKTEEIKGNLSGGTISMLENLRLEEQNSSSFGFTTGLKLGFNLSENIGFYINPRYTYSGSKINYSIKDTESSYIDVGAELPEFSDDLHGQEPFTEKEIGLSTFDVTAGITINLGGNNPPNNEEPTNINPPTCNIIYDGFTCNGTDATLNFTSTWSSHNPNSTIQVEVSQGGIIIASGSQVSNSNIVLGSSNGNLQHSITNSGLVPGTPMDVKIRIFDTNGNEICGYMFDDFFAPNCDTVEKPCNFQIDQSSFSCDTNSVIINSTVSWTNVLPNTNLNIEAVTQGVNSIPIPITTSTNLPMSVNGSGSTSLQINIPRSFIGRPLTIKINYTDPTTGQVISCNGGADFTVPNCPNNELCSLEAEVNNCDSNGKTFVDFIARWVNYTNPANFDAHLYLRDSNGSPINVPGNTVPLGTGNTSGSTTFRVDLSQYAGTTIEAKLAICPHGSSKDCCEKIIKVEIPKCCIDCTDIEIEDTTPYTNPNIIANEFPITGYFNSKPVVKVMFQLEAFSAFNLQGATRTYPDNFEFSKNSRINNATANLVGSLLGDRSNLIIQEFNTPISSGVNFKLMIDNYTSKKHKDYRVKVTAFFADGTYCESYL